MFKIYIDFYNSQIVMDNFVMCILTMYILYIERYIIVVQYSCVPFIQLFLSLVCGEKIYDPYTYHTKTDSFLYQIFLNYSDKEIPNRFHTYRQATLTYLDTFLYIFVCLATRNSCNTICSCLTSVGVGARGQFAIR